MRPATSPSRRYKLIAVDTETTGLDPLKHSLLGFSIAWRDPEGSLRSRYYPVGHPTSLVEDNISKEQAVSFLRKMKDQADCLVFHTAPFDIKFLKTLDPEFHPDRFVDVSTLAHMLGAEAEVDGRLSRSLLNLYDAHLHLSKEMRTKLKGLKTERVHLGDRFPSEVDEYARLDAVMTLQLAERLIVMKDLLNMGDLWDLEEEFERLLMTLGQRGLLVHKGRVAEAIHTFHEAAGKIEEMLMQEGLKNISANVQVAAFLYDTLGLDCPKRTPSGGRSVDRKSLESLKGAWQAKKILDWRQYQKAVATWLRPMLEDLDGLGRIHPQWNIGSTRSSRISCQTPNVQQIPLSEKEHLVYKSLGGVFTAPEGFTLVGFDYKQADLRLATILSKEDAMAEAFQFGTDPYEVMALKIWGKCNKDLRFKAKQFALATMYSMGARTAAKTFNISTREAKKILAAHRKTFPRYVQANRKATIQAERMGSVTLWTRRSLKMGLFEPSHKAFAWTVQGGVAEMVKRAMLKTESYLCRRRLRSLQVAQIHDSIVIEMADDERERLVPVIVKIMETILPRKFTDYCPMLVDVSDWG